MKIGMVCYPSLGGSGIVATELGHALASRGHEVHFITYQVPFRLRLDEPNIYFHEVGITEYELFQYPDYALPLAVKIAEVAAEYQLDVLHVHYAIPHATSAFLAKQLIKTKRPVVITTLHGTDITLVGRDPGYFEIVKFSIEHSQGVTAVSESLRQQTKEYFGIQKEIKVIYNFFTPKQEFIKKKIMRPHFVTNEEKLLMHSSNFRSVKRVEDVIRIFDIVKRQVPSKLVLLGTGNGIHEVRKLVNEMELQKEVHFLGTIPFVDPYLASADLFLLPSSQESFGLAAVEAMAYGVPVIATQVGGLPEVVVNGKTGFLCPVGDIQAMSNAAIRLLTDADFYKKVSQAAAQHVQKKFNTNIILSHYEAFYQQALDA